MFCKKCLLRNFAKFTGKHPYHSLFFNKVAGQRLVTLLKKETLAQVFSCEFFKISKSTFSYRTPPVVVSVITTFLFPGEVSDKETADMIAREQRGNLKKDIRVLLHVNDNKNKPQKEGNTKAVNTLLSPESLKASSIENQVEGETLDDSKNKSIATSVSSGDTSLSFVNAKNNDDSVNYKKPLTILLRALLKNKKDDGRTRNLLKELFTKNWDQNIDDINLDLPQPNASLNPNPVPPEPVLNKFIQSIHAHALSKEPMKTTAEGVLPNFINFHQGYKIQNDVTTPLRINGGKVLGGNVRGGSILGGVVSGGEVSGGEITGGRITGGFFKNGFFMDGELENGVVEGGKIKGGKITGGDVKSGLVEGGEVKGGVVEGGHLINGTVEGGDFKGGEIIGGKLISGEMDGGVLLRNGTINGGLLKGGTIESGSLNGGVMLGGILRGGEIKSGVIRGGIIDKGVIVQDAEIGPGVEIHEGIIKGGKITVQSLSSSPNSNFPTQPSSGTQDVLIDSSESFFGNTPLTMDTSHTTDQINRSNIMYSIKVLPKPTESFKASIIQGETSTFSPSNDRLTTTKNESPSTLRKIIEDKMFLEHSLNKMGGEDEEKIIETHAGLKNTILPKSTAIPTTTVSASNKPFLTADKPTSQKIAIKKSTSKIDSSNSKFDTSKTALILKNLHPRINKDYNLTKKVSSVVQNVKKSPQQEMIEAVARQHEFMKPKLEQAQKMLLQYQQQQQQQQHQKYNQEFLQKQNGNQNGIVLRSSHQNIS